MKKLLCLLTVLVLCLTVLVACGGETETTPETTTTAASTTTEAPGTTTEAPGTTTEAPVTTTEAPVTTTEAPVTTTETPITSTEAPASSSEAPETPEKPEAICINDIAGVTAYVYAFENPSEFGGPVGLIYYFQDDTTGHANTVATGIANNSMYAVVKLDGEAYTIQQYANGVPYFRFNIETPGAVIFAGLTYEIVVEIYDTDGNLLYYTKPESKVSNLSTANVPKREPMNITLPEGLTKLTVDGSAATVEDMTPWGDGPVANLFDGNKTSTKLGGNTNGTPTIYFTLKEAATISYYTFTTGADTGTYTDRNPVGWTLYGKVNGEWVVLSEVISNKTQVTGFEPADSTSYSYAVSNKQSCTEYKIVLLTGGGFQLNELELYTDED